MLPNQKHNIKHKYEVIHKHTKKKDQDRPKVENVKVMTINRS